MSEILYKESINQLAIFDNKKVSVVCDKNTYAFKDKIKDLFKNCIIDVILFDTCDYIPSINNANSVIEKSKTCDLLVGLGSGSINDTCKFASTKLNKVYMSIPTAPSMDGYLSSGAALMNENKKITYSVKVPDFVYIDYDILSTAPTELISSGYGDIIGKYTCLADWHLSNIINGESIKKEAYELMNECLNKVSNNTNLIINKDKEGVKFLIDALLNAGIAMAISGDSRPASGSEHHISHYIEEDCVRRGETIPSHGFKVGLGTLISLELYNYLKNKNINIINKEKIDELIQTLPSVEEVKEKLRSVGCPIRFSEINISKELFIETIKNAYTMRSRYTILTLFNQYKLWNGDLVNYLVSKYY